MNIRPHYLPSAFTAPSYRRIAVTLLLALFGSWAGTSQAANYTFYGDQNAWSTAVTTNSLASIVTTSGLSGYGPPSIYYYGQEPLPYLQNSSSAPLGTAFGGSFDLTPGGNGGGLAFVITFADSTTIVVWGAVNYPSGFWGIVSDTTINSVQTISNDLTGNGESFNYSLLTLQFPQIKRICPLCRPIPIKRP